MEGNGEKKTYIRWIVAVVLIFALMGASIYGVAKKTYDDMSDAAIQNLNENLNLMRNTVEAIMRSEAAVPAACRRRRSPRRPTPRPTS